MVVEMISESDGDEALQEMRMSLGTRPMRQPAVPQPHAVIDVSHLCAVPHSPARCMAAVGTWQLSVLASLIP